MENNIYRDGSKFESNVSNGKIKANLRLEYEQDVQAIVNQSKIMLKNGNSEEEVARWMVDVRNNLKIKYREDTPLDKLKEIQQRNTTKYGNPLGPSADYLHNIKGKSWSEIIKSSSKPGGGDLDFSPPGFHR